MPFGHSSKIRMSGEDCVQGRPEQGNIKSKAASGGFDVDAKGVRKTYFPEVRACSYFSVGEDFSVVWAVWLARRAAVLFQVHVTTTAPFSAFVVVFAFFT